MMVILSPPGRCDAYGRPIPERSARCPRCLLDQRPDPAPLAAITPPVPPKHQERQEEQLRLW